MVSLLQLFRRCFKRPARRPVRRRAASTLDRGECLEVRALMSAVPAVEYPSTIRAGHTWYFPEDPTANNVIETRGFGLPGDQYLVGDWNGDRRQDLVVVRPNAQGGLDWLIDLTADNIPDLTHKYGLAGDTPVLGDWDGNGNDDPGVARNNPATGLIDWYLDPTRTPNSNPRSRPFGLISRADKPVVGDWNGDGKDTLGVAHSNPANGYLTWRLDANGDPTEDEVLNFGLWNTGDVPVVGDWDGDGKDNLGVVRTESGGLAWYMDLDKDPAAERTRKFGLAGDIPVAIERTASPSGSDPDDQFEEADRVHNLGKIVREVQFQDSISVKTDVDMLRFEVVAGQTVNFDIDTADNGPPGLGSYLRVFDAAGKELAANNDRLGPGDSRPKSHPDNDADGFDSYISYRFAKAGVYYVGVSNWQHFKYDPKTGRDEIAPSPKWLTGAYNLVITTDFVATGTLSLSNAKFVQDTDQSPSRISLNWAFNGFAPRGSEFRFQLFYSTDQQFDGSDVPIKGSFRSGSIKPATSTSLGSLNIDFGTTPFEGDPARPFLLIVAQPTNPILNLKPAFTSLILPKVDLTIETERRAADLTPIVDLMQSASFVVSVPRAVDPNVQNYEIQINVNGSWQKIISGTLPVVNWTARLAGLLEVRAVVTLQGTRFYSNTTTEAPFNRTLQVEFPHWRTMFANPEVQLIFHEAHRRMLGLLTPATKQELSAAIYFDTLNGTYHVGDFTEGKAVGHDRQATTPGPKILTDLVRANSGSLLSGRYAVAIVHTHPPLTYAKGNSPQTILGRSIGPSENDRKSLLAPRYVNFVTDFLPASTLGQLTNSLFPGEPVNPHIAPWKAFHFGAERRPLKKS